MALNDAATLVVGTGNFLTATVGTAMPADLSAPGVEWSNIGHTALDNVFAATSTGGDATVLGTLQNASLRTTYSARTESFTIDLQQFDQPALKLFFGSNSVILPDGSVGVPENPEPTTVAFLAVFIDGEDYFGIYAPKAQIYRGDDLTISDTSSLASLPLAVTPLVSSPNTWSYAVTPLGTVSS